MEFKGTKGEWGIKTNDYYIDVSNVSEEEKKVFTCSIHLTKERSFLKFEADSLCEENLANALIISKAPEMLELLQKISLSLQMFDPPTKEIALVWSEEIDTLIKSATEL